ncbi:MAG TPA: wax ester/triacylglycerol synthase family O-acyltransferase [Terriglobales bacterium]|nr:wax ester/triacylglycerol synthase family O-acyltransferase [Terriglobales bacterium]
MKNGSNSDRLAWGDALFLYLEREGMPLNIASVSIFEGDFSVEDCRAFIASKLPLLPRYYQRVVTPPLNVGFPSWENDPDFDICNHIREISLKNGSEAGLKTLAGKILGKVMNRQRPLWDLTVVRGLKGNRTGLIVRIHHCLADGIAGIGLMNILMDSNPELRPVANRKKIRQRRRAQDPLTQLLDGLLSAYSDVVERVLTAESSIASMGERIAAGGGFPAEEFSELLPELSAPTERLFFNVTYQGPQNVAWVKIPLADITAVRERCGGKHNDVVLTVITAAVRRYAEVHGDSIKGRLLRMMVPVSVRDAESACELGNRISLLPVTIPLDIRPPLKLLAAVRQRTEFLKRAHIAELVGLAGGLVGFTPAPVQALVGPVASLLPITPFNLVCTNVRGPEAPLYLIGHKMLDWYPYVPVGGEMTLNCATLSYNGMSYFGFSGDVNAAPDLQNLEKFLDLSFKELQHAAGIRPPHKKRAKSKKPVEPARTPSRVPPVSIAPSSIVAERTQSTTAEEEAVPAPLAAD